jgi:hypothetical protein
MAVKYSFEKKQEYLYMILAGEYSKEDLKFYIKMIRDTCAMEKINKVLVNALAINGTDISTMDRFTLGVELAKQLGPKIKIAVIWHESNIDKFAETVAINRGGHIFVVGDMAKGEDWLLSDN